jgi:hypothetical protein
MRGLLLTLATCALVLPAYAKYSGGTGEPNDPYRIATAADLITLGETSADYDKHFILTADIDLDPNLPGRKAFDDAVIAPLHSGWRGWATPLFAGVFDGHNHTIRNLTIVGNGYLGLLGGLQRGAAIVNLGLEAVDIHGGDAGGLAGWNYGSITNCSSTGIVRAHGSAGGLVGHNSGSISNCYSTSTVIGDGRAGGLVGANGGGYGCITDCYSAGPVSGKNKVGGLVGENEYGNTASSFWDTQTSGQTTSAGGLGLTTAQMQDVGTYLSAGWDFFEESSNGTCDWWQTSLGGYPELRHLAGGRPVMPEGLGTPEKPYLIRNARDLGTVWSDAQAYYRLEVSIDLTGLRWSTAVIPCFGGILDANGHAIRGLRIRGGNYVGLVGRLGHGAMISNLGLEVADVNALGDHVGSLVGWSYGKIVNCRIDGTVTGRDWGAGGLVGWNLGSITDSHSAAVVSGQAYVGGLAGINECSTGVIANSSNTGAINAGARVGGLVGWNLGSIHNSYSTGAIRGLSLVGGLVGDNSNLGSITNCYSTGVVSGNGLDVNGLIGIDNWGRVQACFWDIQASGLTTRGAGTGKTTAEMQMESTFTDVGWDFVGETDNGTEDIWWIDEGKDYPRLWWEESDEASQS